MSNEEFTQNEKEIMAQTKAFKGTMPFNRDMYNETLTGGAVYVAPYVRADGIKVNGHYRSR